MECRKNELPGASRKTARQRRKNAADKTLGNRTLSVCGREPLRTRRAYPRYGGTVLAVDGSPQPTGGLPLCTDCNARCFSEEDSVQRSSRRTASPPSKMIAEGKRGRRFYERLPRTVLKSAAIRGRSQGRRRRLQRPCFRPWSAGRSPPARRFQGTHGQGPWWLRPPRNQNEASRPG